jgi:outer membrane translocation and assembly module TamA
MTQLRNGPYPAIGSVYPGGGLALGPGYRRFYGDRALWHVSGMISIRNYKQVELATVSPGHAQGRLDLFARTSWLDARSVPFYPLGIDSVKSSRLLYRMKETTASAGARLRPVWWTVLGGNLAYEDFNVDAERDLTILEARNPSVFPGIGASPTYIHSWASGAIDWRPSEGYARKGGLYEVQYHNFHDRDGALSFDRVDGEVVQHLPLLRENWVLSFRARVQTTLDDADVVPYFLLPSLGSGSTLRGYSSFRFRDRHSELFSAEWRWIPNRFGFDMALFYDAGKVVSQRADLDFNGLKSDIGVGARFHGPANTPLRIEVARGKEGMRLVFASSAAF